VRRKGDGLLGGSGDAQHESESIRRNILAGEPARSVSLSCRVLRLRSRSNSFLEPARVSVPSPHTHPSPILCTAHSSALPAQPHFPPLSPSPQRYDRGTFQPEYLRTQMMAHAGPGGTAGPRESMTARQCPLLASMSVTPDVSEVGAEASGPMTTSQGARKAIGAKAG
jgi:hypothetical protein